MNLVRDQLARLAAAELRLGVPTTPTTATERRGRPARPQRAIASQRTGVAARSGGRIELIELQVSYQDWLDSSPENLRDGATAEALAAVCGLDLSELEGVIPPRGFGRDCPAHPWSAHRGPRKPADGSVAPWTGETCLPSLWTALVRLPCSFTVHP